MKKEHERHVSWLNRLIVVEAHAKQTCMEYE